MSSRSARLRLLRPHGREKYEPGLGVPALQTSAVVPRAWRHPQRALDEAAVFPCEIALREVIARSVPKPQNGVADRVGSDEASAIFGLPSTAWKPPSPNP